MAKYPYKTKIVSTDELNEILEENVDEEIFVLDHVANGVIKEITTIYSSTKGIVYQKHDLLGSMEMKPGHFYLIKKAIEEKVKK